MIRAYAARTPGGMLEAFEYDPGTLHDHDVEVSVDYCGLCHSDLSMIDNEWGSTRYPLVPGHEGIGTVVGVGRAVTNLHPGQRVGIGWQSGACMTCDVCMSGDHNLCGSRQATIRGGHHGAFADRVRGRSEFVIPLPAELDAASAGPLFCGGITVFNPLVQFNVPPTARVGVIGIGGLGHMAVKFLKAWGCEVTAFSSSADKEDEVRKAGARHFIDSGDPDALAAARGTLDFIISTVNASLDWNAYINALRTRGRLHLVGVATRPASVDMVSMMASQKSLSGSSVGSPSNMIKMLEFAARHDIRPTIEMYPFGKVNEAIDRLRSGNARYRVVLAREVA